MDCPLEADNTFGPQYCNHFDFTLLFEQSFFQLAPSAILLLVLPLRAFKLRRQDIKTLRTGLQTVKQIVILLLAAIQFALLIVWIVTPVFRTEASIPAVLLSFLASLALLYLSSIEHTRSTRPSSTINTFIFFSILFDVPQARTLWMRMGRTAVPKIFTAGLAVKMILCYFEARNKKRSLLPPYRLYAPEALASLYNRTVLWWLIPLFIKGYWDIMSVDGLIPIDDDLSSNRLEKRFHRHWKKRLASAKIPLLRTAGRVLLSPLLNTATSRLCLSAFKLSQPLLIHRVTSWLSQGDRDVNYGYGLIGATALVYVGMAFTNVISKRESDRFLTKLRATFVSAIHSKSLGLPADQLTNGLVLTLISNDVNRICNTLQQFIELLTAPVEIIIAIYLLESEIGIACIAPVVISLISSGVSFLNSNKSIPLQKKWLLAVQERLAYTAAVLNCPKGFKMLGLTDYLRDRIQDLRLAELNEYAQYRKFVTFRGAYAAIPANLAPPLTMMMFTLIHSSSALKPSVTFTSLSLVSLLTKPIREIVFAVPSFITAMASMDRIEAFLLLNRGELEFGGVALYMHQPDMNGIELASITAPTDTLTVKLEEVTISLGNDNQAILEDVSLVILPKTLNFIVGPVGSGKSTLLRTIIGDVPLTRGRMIPAAKDAIGFCSQEPWLPNETVEKIILGQSEIDPQWYTTVVEACALNIDIATFPAGKETVVGNNGVSLSGGQKQRVALARALYSRKSILILDDVLSGLDARSAKHIVDYVLGPKGLCKKHGITTVMATHAVQYLHYADHIIALDDKGKIIEQGSFESLNSPNGYVYGHKLSRKQHYDEEDINAAAPKSKPVVTRNTDDEPQQELARRTGDSTVYKYYARSLGWKSAFTIVLTAIAFAFSNKFPEVWVRWWSDSEVSADSRHSLGHWVGIYVLIGTLAVVFVFAQIWVMLVWSVPRSAAKLHQQLLDSVMNAPYSFFIHTDSGVTLNRFANDMSLIEIQLADAVMHTQNGACVCIASAILIAAGARYVGIIMPFAVILLYLLQKFYLRTSRQLRFLELESQAPLLTHYQETVMGVTTIRAFGWQESAHTTCLKLLDRSQRPYYLMLCIQRWLGLVLDLTAAVIATLIVALAMTLNGTATAGSVGLSLLNIITFNSQLSQLILDWTTLETSLGAIARCKNFEASTPSEHLEGEIIEPPNEWPSAGQITLSNMSASYAEGDAPILQNISLIIQPGTKVGICGRSGSGKSSLLLTLLRMLDPSSGQMELDGFDLATLPRALIRSRIAVLPQDALCIPGSVCANLDPLGKSNTEEISNALTKVGLFELINERGGIEGSMNNLGLSQGEMQLFTVARALLHPSRVLIVDEMTSAVDAATERRILDIIRMEFKQSTVIAVAHRLWTMANFDTVVVMDAGKIVEHGPPAKLLEKSDGWFKTMCERC